MSRGGLTAGSGLCDYEGASNRVCVLFLCVAHSERVMVHEAHLLMPPVGLLSQIQSELHSILPLRYLPSCSVALLPELPLEDRSRPATFDAEMNKRP